MRYYGNIHSKLPIFRVKSVKFTPAKKKLHENSRGFRDKYEVCDGGGDYAGDVDDDEEEGRKEEEKRNKGTTLECRRLRRKCKA